MRKLDCYLAKGHILQQHVISMVFTGQVDCLSK